RRGSDDHLGLVRQRFRSVHLRPKGNLVAASAAGGTTFERALVTAASGTYDVVVVPFTVVQSGYQGVAQFISQKASKVPGGGPAAYYGTFVSGANPANAPKNKAVW